MSRGPTWKTPYSNIIFFEILFLVILGLIDFFLALLFKIFKIFVFLQPIIIF